MKVAAGAILAGAAIGAKFLSGAIEEAREAQVVTARTESVLKSMGLAGEVSAAQIGNLATAISLKTGIDDEAIQSGQNLLLTFKNIASSAGEAGGVFEQTSRLMVDLSAGMGTDAKGAAIQLGKALNDPVKGITALTRVGVSFSEAQKKQIAGFMETGQIAKAQGVILGELKNQFGGAAEAMATPADKARVAWANFKEQIGTLLLPIIDKLLATLTTSVIPAVSSFVAGIQSGTGAGGQFASIVGTIASNFDLIAISLGSVTAGLGAYKVAMAASAAITAVQTAGTTAATGATWSLNAALRANPIGLVVTAITLLVAGLVIAYKRSETFRNIVNAVWDALKVAIGFVVNLAQKLGGPLVVAIGVVIGVVQNMIGWVRDKAAAAWESFKSKAIGAAQAVIGPIQNVIDKVQALVSFVREKALAIWDTLKSKAVSAFNAMIAPIQWVIDKVQALIDKVQAAIDKIQSIPGIPGGDAQGNGTLVGGVPKRSLVPTAPTVPAPSGRTVTSEAAVLAALARLERAIYTVAPDMTDGLNGTAARAQRSAA